MINRLCRFGSLWLRTLLASVFLSAATFAVFAQAVPATDPVPRVVFPITPSSNSYTFGPRTADAANAAKFSFGAAANGSVFANTGAQLPTPGGASIPIGVGGRIAKPDVVGALGRFVRKAAPVAYPLQVGSALYDLAQELGFTASNDDGPITFAQVSTSGTYGGYPSVDGFCQSRGYHRGVFNSFSYQSAGTYANVTCYWNANGAGFQTPYSATQTTTPATTQQFLDAVAAKSDWPTSSALARATVEAIKSGEAVQVQPETLTGPASSPGPSSTTLNTTNNTSTTTNTTYNYNYEGAKVTVTTTTTTTVRDLSTNEVVSQETKTEQPELPELDAQPTDTANPQVPVLYERKYPDGLVGVWSAKKAQLNTAPLVQLAGQLMPDVGSVGTCPNWSLDLDMGVANMGVWDVSPPCYVWDFAKVVIICSALLLARALVFGG